MKDCEVSVAKFGLLPAKSSVERAHVGLAHPSDLLRRSTSSQNSVTSQIAHSLLPANPYLGIAHRAVTVPQAITPSNGYIARRDHWPPSEAPSVKETAGVIAQLEELAVNTAREMSNAAAKG
jgi:hypothetical protein